MKDLPLGRLSAIASAKVGECEEFFILDQSVDGSEANGLSLT